MAPYSGLHRTISGRRSAGFRHAGLGGASSPLLWSCEPSLVVPGIDNLPATVNINSLDGTTVLRYRGGDATVSAFPAWGTGETLAAASTGTNPTVNDGSPLHGTSDDSVKYNGGVVYQADNATFADITTEDLYIEVFFKTPAAWRGASEYISAKYLGSILQGLSFYYSSSGILQLLIGNGEGIFNTVEYNTALSLNTWYYATCFYDASETYTNGMYLIVNNLVNPSYLNANNPSDMGPLATVNKFTIGSSSGFTNKLNGNLAYFAMAKRSNWFAGGATNLTQWAAYHALRLQLLCGGLYSPTYRGTRSFTFARAGKACVSKYESNVNKIYTLGAGFPPVERLSNGKSVVTPTAAIQNKCLQSAALGTTWTKINAADSIASDAVVSPNGLTTSDGIVADATDTLHGVTQNVTLTAATWELSVFARAGAKDWAYLADTTVANCYAYYNVATGAVGASPGAGVTEAKIYPDKYLNDHYWIKLVFTGTAAAHTFQLCAAHADGDNDFAGNGTLQSIYFHGAQINLGRRWPSIVPTTTAAVTKLADALSYKGDDGNLGGVGSDKQGTLKMQLYSADITLSANATFFKINDGGSAADEIKGYIDTSGVTHFTFTASGGAPRTVDGPAIDVLDGASAGHEIKLAYRVGRAQVTVDGAKGTAIETPIAADIPDDLDKIIPANFKLDAIKFYQKPVW